MGGDLHRKGGDVLLKAFRSLPAGSAELILVTRTKLPAEAGVTVYNNLQPNSAALIYRIRSFQWEQWCHGKHFWEDTGSTFNTLRLREYHT